MWFYWPVMKTKNFILKSARMLTRKGCFTYSRSLNAVIAFQILSEMLCVKSYLTFPESIHKLVRPLHF